MPAPQVKATDPKANAPGYVTDATKVNRTKYPNYAASQACANCALFQGKARGEAGPCPLFAGMEVCAKGWCSAYAKKG